MEEYIDIYDGEGRLTGRTQRRSQPRSPGDYLLAVHIFIRDQQGKWLIQKRSMNKRVLPGAWEITAGAVSAGETSLMGAMRETAEEVGLHPRSEKFIYKGRLKRESSLVDFWLVETAFSLSDCVMQKEEVSDLKLISTADLRKLMADAHYRDQEYRDLVFDFVR